MITAVIGGGINGIMTAMALRRRGHEVDLYERDRLMGATSSASTKLIHGGLRYLEHGSFGLVRESLRERAWWLREAPDLCHPLRILLPMWRGRGRSWAKLKIGLALYDVLAGPARIARHRWLDRPEALRVAPDLNPRELLGAFEFWDAAMDDRALGLRAAEWARSAGVRIHESMEVRAIRDDGVVHLADGPRTFDRVVNVAGPWSRSLLERSRVPSRTSLDLVRGSHLVVNRPCPCGVLAEVEGGRRIAFLLPWKGKSLVGTTEVRQDLSEPIVCSPDERQYLRRFHDQVRADPLKDSEIHETFSGLRPLVSDQAREASAVTREYRIERQGVIVSLFGGKWTTSRVLGERAAEAAER